LIERGVEGLLLVGRVEDTALLNLIKGRNLVALSHLFRQSVGPLDSERGIRQLSVHETSRGLSAGGSGIRDWR